MLLEAHLAFRCYCQYRSLENWSGALICMNVCVHRDKITGFWSTIHEMKVYIFSPWLLNQASLLKESPGSSAEPPSAGIKWAEGILERNPNPNHETTPQDHPNPKQYRRQRLRRDGELHSHFLEYGPVPCLFAGRSLNPKP